MRSVTSEKTEQCCTICPCSSRNAVTDISALKAAEAAALSERRNASALLQTASDGIHVLDAAGNVLATSDSIILDTTKPMWLSAFSETTKESGFYRTTLNARRAPEKVVMDPVRYGTPSKAEKADVYMLVAGREL